MPNSLVLSQGQQHKQTIFLANKRYALFEVIASTALATFYHATDTRTLESDQSASRVVVGIVNPALDQINGFTAALPRVLDEFTDPVVTPYINEHGFENGQYWFALPNLKGTPLHSYISQTGRFGYPVSDTLNTAEHIIKAVRQSPLKKEFGYLEPGAIYYEPENGHCILLNAPIAITLNIVAQSNHNKELSRPTLHSGYLSPEVALGKSPTDYDDCFSIATIVYQMLNGHLPFVNDHSVEAALKKSLPAAIVKLEPESSQVVLNALSFERGQRPSSAEELLHQIHNPPPLIKEAGSMPGWVKLSGSALIMLGVAYGAFNYASHNGQSSPDPAIAKNPDNNEEQLKLTELQKQYEQEAQKLADLKKQQEEETQRLSVLKKQQEEESQRLAQLTQTTKETSKRINSEKEAEKRAKALALQQQKEKEAEKKLRQQKEKEEKARLATQKQQKELAEQLAKLKKQREADEQKAAFAAAQKQREAEERRAAFAAAQKQREAEERRAAFAAAQKQREAEERRAAFAAAQKQREAEERRAAFAAAQKQREAEERRAAWQKKQEAEKRRAAAQKQLEAEERRIAAQKQRETEKRRAAAQKQREAEERRAAWQKKQESAAYQTASVSRKISYPTPAPRFIRKINPRFFNPRLFGRIPANDQSRADQGCRSIGGIKALGFHPRAIGLDNSVFPSYFCAFNRAELNYQRLIAVNPSKNSPRLEQKVSYTWTNQQNFGAIPNGMAPKGNQFCSQYGFRQAIKYHPGAIGINGAPISGGGYLCQ